jgi:hypothetical protein
LHTVVCSMTAGYFVAEWKLLENSLQFVMPVECVCWTEPKATCRQCKNQPNAYNMYTDSEGIRVYIFTSAFILGW